MKFEQSWIKPDNTGSLLAVKLISDHIGSIVGQPSWQGEYDWVWQVSGDAKKLSVKSKYELAIEILNAELVRLINGGINENL